METNTSKELTILELKAEQIIYNIHQYFLAESRRYRDIKYSHFKNVLGRVSKATCVPEKCVRRILYRCKLARNRRLLTTSLELLEKKKKEPLDTNINTNDDTDNTNIPMEISSASDNECTAPTPPKTSKLQIIAIQDEHKETICVDTDSNESLKDVHPNEPIENKINLPKWRQELPKLSKPNVPSTVNPYITITGAYPAVLPKLPKLIKYGPCKVQTEMNNNIPQTSYIDDSIMNNLPPLVKHTPIYANTEMTNPNQGPIFIGGKKMPHVNTINVDTLDGQKATLGFVLSPVPVLLDTKSSITYTSELLNNGTNVVSNVASNVALCETLATENDPKIIKVESLAEACHFET